MLSMKVFALCALVGRVAAGVPPTIVHVIADDLGWNDLGFANGGKTHTPHIDKSVTQGILLTSYHTYKVCSPSRASMLSGRYPWGVGYYDMKGPESVPLDFELLPVLLKKHAGYETHAIGKWNLGATTKDYTPTFRGFDSFLGYYNAATSDYWYHGGSLGGCSLNGKYCTDLSNSSGPMVADGVNPASDALNGTYNSDIFTSEAVRLIQKHASSKTLSQQGLYMYVAYQNVHSTAQNAKSLSGLQPIQAPCEVIDEHYSHTPLDTYKAMGGMLTMLDYGVGNITRALDAAGHPYVLVFNSDNGGPLPHATNAPLRGGKHTLWDGGLRVRSFVTGPLIPEARRGSTWGGLAHSSDWYLTFVEGVANVSLTNADINATGPRKPDGFNLWPALLEDLDSPRSEIIHQVANSYTEQEKLKDPPTITSGHFKLIMGAPGDNRIVPWPDSLAAPLAFGTNGTRNGYPEEQGSKTNRCRAPSNKGHTTPDPDAPDCTNGCLFDLSADPSESKNLINDKSKQDILQRLTLRLKDAASSGPPWAFPYAGAVLKSLNNEICKSSLKTGYYEPVRTSGPPPGPAPPPGPSPPSPVPASCEAACKKDCPLKKYPSYDDCLSCTRKSEAAKEAACKPKERKAYCNQTAVDADLMV